MLAALCCCGSANRLSHAIVITISATAEQCHYHCPALTSCPPDSRAGCTCCCRYCQLIVMCHYHYSWRHDSTPPLPPLSLCSAMTPLQPDNNSGCTSLLWLPLLDCRMLLSLLLVPRQRNDITAAFTVFGHDAIAVRQATMLAALCCCSCRWLIVACHCH